MAEQKMILNGAHRKRIMEQIKLSAENTMKNHGPRSKEYLIAKSHVQALEDAIYIVDRVRQNGGIAQLLEYADAGIASQPNLFDV